MTKLGKVLVLVLMLTVMLHISPAQACACGMPDWSVMSAEQVVSTVNEMKDESRIRAGEHGDLPAAPGGYRYGDDYRLIPLK
jgi:hypothetical protein